MNDKKVTAVEWLVGELNLGLSEKGLKLAFQTAVELEKQQIIEAYYYDPNCNQIKDDGEQYYNETYEQ